MIKQASAKEIISPNRLPLERPRQQLYTNTASNSKRSLMACHVDSMVPPAKKIKKDYVCKQTNDSLEEMTKNMQSDNKKEDPCNRDIISSLVERYLSIKPDYFFDLSLVDTKRRVSISLEKVMAACSEEVIGLRSCILIEGESGRGKTILLRHLASQWAEKKVLQDFSAVFLYEVYVEKQYNERDRSRKDQSRDDNFIHQLEEDAKHLHGSTDRKDILILLDSFWYLPTQSIIHTCRKYFPKAAIVFTAQSSFVKEIKSNEIYFITHYFKVLGYEPINVIDNVLQVLLPPSPKLHHQVEHFQSWLETNPFAQALIHCPLYCKMLTELCLHDALPKYLENLTELFKLYVIFMINKSRVNSHPIEYFSDLTGDDELLFRSIVEMSFIFPKIYKADSCGSRLNESFGLLKEISFNVHRIVSFVNSSVMAYFMALSYTVSVSKPIYLPFDWSVFCLYLAGMKSVDKLIQRAFNYHSNSWQQTEKKNLFQVCLIVFELQSSILEIGDNFLHNKVCECMENWGIQTQASSVEADPIAFYVLGWIYTSLCSAKSHSSSYLQDLVFDIPYVSQISKFLFYFAKGTEHIAKLYDCSKTLLWRLRIENVVDDVDECLQYLIDANLCKYVTKLQFSGTVNLANLAEIAANQHLSSLTNLNVTGKLTGEYNDAFSTILPSLCQLNQLAFHNSDNIYHAVDLKCLQATAIVCNSMTIDGISPEFFIASLKKKEQCRLESIKIMNCTLSPVIIESLIEWVTVMQSNRGGLRRSLSLQGQGILNVETSIQIARTLESVQNSFHDYDKPNFSIYLNDTTMSSVALSLIVDVVSSLKCHEVHLYIPIKYMYDFGERYSLKYSDMD